MKKPTIRQKKGRLIFNIAKLIKLENDKRGSQIKEDMQKLKYNTLNTLIELLDDRKNHITLFKHVTDGGAVYLTDDFVLALAKVAIRLNGKVPELIECKIT